MGRERKHTQNIINGYEEIGPFPSQLPSLNKSMLHVQYFKNDSILKGFGFNVDLTFLLIF